MPNPLFDALFARAGPDAVAIESASTTLTYADLAAASADYAGAFASLGVKPGDRIAAQIEKSVTGLIAYIGAIRAGAAWTPLNPAYTSAEIDHFLDDLAPTLTLIDPARRGAVAKTAKTTTLDAAGRGSLADLANGQTGSSAPSDRAEADLAAICYTSGTTGRSKGAMLSHSALVSNARSLVDLWRFTADDVLIHALPIYHMHGLFVATHVALMSGGRIIFQPRFDVAEILAAMPRATALMGVPTFYTRLLAEPGLSGERAAAMRLFISGSAPLLAATHASWRERTGHAVLERYGLTETSMNASNPYAGERIAGTVGFPLPGISIRVTDADTHAPLAPGAAGMIEVKGPNLFSGYWRTAAETRSAFTPDGFFITGDIGVFDGQGRLSIVGRAKDLIISGGLNIYPKEVEERIDALAGVVESAVIGLPHSDLGEAVTAVVVGEPDAELTQAKVLNAIAPSLARFKQPRRVIFAEALPRNAMGKVQKSALRARHAGLYVGGRGGKIARRAKVTVP